MNTRPILLFALLAFSAGYVVAHDNETQSFFEWTDAEACT